MYNWQNKMFKYNSLAARRTSLAYHLKQNSNCIFWTPRTMSHTRITNSMLTKRVCVPWGGVHISIFQDGRHFHHSKYAESYLGDYWIYFHDLCVISMVCGGIEFIWEVSNITGDWNNIIFVNKMYISAKTRIKPVQDHNLWEKSTTTNMLFAMDILIKVTTIKIVNVFYFVHWVPKNLTLRFCKSDYIGI